MTRKTEADDHGQIMTGVTGAVSASDVVPSVIEGGPTEAGQPGPDSTPDHRAVSAPEEVKAAHKFTDAWGVTHTIREPHRCLVYWPAGQRYTLDRGSRIEEDGRVPAEAPNGAEDLDTAIATVEAVSIAKLAQNHDIQVIRVEQSGRGSILNDLLRDAGFFVIPFNG